MRSEIEEKLLLRRFPGYSGAVREIVQEAKSSADQQLGVETVAAIWESHRPPLKHLKSFDPELATDSSWLEAYQSGKLDHRMIAQLAQYLEAAYAYDKFLRDASDDVIRNAQRRDHAEKRRRAEEQARERDAFAWFNLPDCDLDLGYWQGLNNISAEEAAAIALTKDPRKVKAERLRPYVKVSRSLFCEEYGRLVRSAESYVANNAKGDAFTWNEMLIWIEREGLSLEIEKVPHVNEVNDLETRKSHTYQQVVFSLLLSRCGFDRNLERTNQVKLWSVEVSKLLSEAGLDRTERTVRVCLTEVYNYYRSVEDRGSTPPNKKGDAKQ